MTRQQSKSQTDKGTDRNSNGSRQAGRGVAMPWPLTLVVFSMIASSIFWASNLFLGDTPPWLTYSMEATLVFSTLVFCTYAVLEVISDNRKRRASRYWPSTEGEIVYSGIVTETDTFEGCEYERQLWKVKFKYFVSGVEYESDRGRGDTWPA